MSAEQDGVQSVIEEARNWVRNREHSVRGQLNKQAVNRLWGQTYNPEKLEDLHQGLEEDGIAVNPGLVKNAAHEAHSDAVGEFNDTLERLYDGFEEVAAEFASSIYEQEGDKQRTLEILEETAYELANESGFEIPYEISSIDGYVEFRDFINEERQTFHRINGASAPSVETLREEYYPEIPNEAYENFRELFGSEGTIDVTEQTEIQDFE